LTSDYFGRPGIFTSLRLEMLEEMALKRQLDAIAQMREQRQLK
jgi:hypothetical protein